MKKNYIFLAALAMQMLPASAQDTYQSAKLIENDLNGTARYVGMGGAMEALGADISTMSTNPAGIGLFRNSQVSLSGGLLFQTGADNKMRYNHSEINFNGKKTNLSFDQIGIVWTMPAANRRSFLNIGFNYRKSRNFDQILTAANDLGGASQNRLTAIKYNYNVTKKKNEYQLPWNGVDVNYEGWFKLEEALLSGKPEGLKHFGDWPTVYEGLSSLPEHVQKLRTAEHRHQEIQKQQGVVAAALLLNEIPGLLTINRIIHIIVIAQNGSQNLSVNKLILYHQHPSSYAAHRAKIFHWNHLPLKALPITSIITATSRGLGT